MTFLQPFLLALTVLAGIPVLIHLLGERRYKDYYFSTIRFLKEIRSDALQKIKLIQWLILMIRTLWIIMLVMAFAQPFWHSLAGGAAPEPGIVLLDESASMNLDHSMSATESDIDKMLPGWRFVRISSPDQVNDSLKSNISRYFRDMKRIRKNIFILTDLQANSLTDSLLSLAALADQTLIIQKADERNEHALISLVPDSRFHSAADYNGLNIQAASAAGSSDLPVSLMVNGQRVGQMRLDETGRGEFRFVPGDVGWVSGYASLNEDPVPADNRRFFAFPVHQRSRILVIREREDMNYLVPALESMNDLQMSFIFPAELAETDLSGFDLIILFNFYEMPSAQVNRLITFGEDHPLWILPGESIPAVSSWYALVGGKPAAVKLASGYQSLWADNVGVASRDFEIQGFYRPAHIGEEQLWETTGGKPLLSRFQKRIYVQWLPFSFNWNRSGLSIHFNELIRRTLQNMLHTNDPMITVEESIVFPGETFLVTTPSGNRIQAISRFSDTVEPGIYQIDRQGLTSYIAVNYPEQEMIFSVRDPGNYPVLEWNDTNMDTISDALRGRAAASWFLMAAALFLVFELILLSMSRQRG